MSVEGLSEYELQRLENIKEMKEQLSDVFQDVQNSASDLAKLAKKQTAQKTKRRKVLNRQQPTKQYFTRSALRKSTPNYVDSGTDNETLPQGLVVKFPWHKTKNRGDGDVSSDEDSSEYTPKRRRLTKTVPPIRLSVSQITREMLDNVYFSSSGKQYSADGTTCHQCRQKTLDQKTYCRYRKCIGVRGMFCGFCLLNRYGENVVEALLQKNWACPLCRNICNCSICRVRAKKLPTGPMVLLALKQGFKSVRHFLQEMEGENPAVLTSDEEEEEEK